MINDKTLDEALLEIMRCKKALEALRKGRKSRNICPPFATCSNCFMVSALPVDACPYCQETHLEHSIDRSREHAAAKRASLDLTRKLADLRAGR